MDLCKYRQYVVNSDPSKLDEVMWNIRWNHNNKTKYWTQIFMQGVPHCPYCRMVTVHATPRQCCIQDIEEDIVLRGDAFWANDTTLCLGYQLKNNHDIFRPIFGYDRQIKIDLFLNNIKRVVKKREEKRAFIELFKIKRFPRVLVEKIIKLAY